MPRFQMRGLETISMSRPRILAVPLKGFKYLFIHEYDNHSVISISDHVNIGLFGPLGLPQSYLTVINTVINGLVDERLWLFVRQYVKCTHGYPWTYKGTVRAPSVVSGRGYCLQTARLESRAALRPTLQVTGSGGTVIVLLQPYY